jgi:hypothetical protein
MAKRNIRAIKGIDIMRSKAIFVATLLCVPAAAVLIANAPVAAADNAMTNPACFPANVVRTAAQAGDLHMACTPGNPAAPTLSQNS